MKKFLMSMVFLSSIYAAALAKADPAIQPIPDWVISEESSIYTDVVTAPPTIANGIYYLESDYQTRVTHSGEVFRFREISARVENEEGLDEFSKIQISYDPSYQSLIFHHIDVFREGEKSNRLDRSEIKILNQESELKDGIYNGDETATVFINNLKVGDVVRYAYTLIGDNPVYDGFFSHSRALDWTIPIHFQRVRVLWEKENPLQYKILPYSGRNKPSIVVKKGVNSQDYLFEEYHVEPVERIENNTPDWYTNRSFIAFSNATSWNKVAKWTKGLYQVAYLNDPEVAQIAKGIEESSTSQAQKIARALIFVQRNIRYLGLEMGENSHRPSAPKETLQRLYGDCKDVTTLFISLLHHMGIYASPALVNTEIGKRLNDYIPSAGVFDHVITHVKLHGKEYWLDPTRTYQAGSLSEIFQPDYGYALDMDRPFSLVKMAKEEDTKLSNTKLFLNEHFVVFPDSKKVGLTADTQYQGLDYEIQKSRLNRDGKSALGETFENFYTESHGPIKTKSTLVVQDDEEEGKLTYKESYEFVDGLTEKGGKLVFFAAAHGIDVLSDPEDKLREMPFEIPFPEDIEHQITIEVAGIKVNFKKEKIHIENDFFVFDLDVMVEKSDLENIDPNNSALKAVFKLRTKQDFVPVGDLDKYIEDLRKVHEVSGYRVKLPISATQTNNTVAQNLKEVVLPHIAVFMVFGLLAVFVYAFISWRDESKQRPEHGTQFFQINTTKLFLLSFFSLGIYTYYWAYRNWQSIKESDNSKIHPIWRSLFSVIWFYPLFLRIFQNRLQARSLYITYLSLTALHFVSDIWFYTFIGYLFLIVYVAHKVNEIEGENINDALRYNSKWRFSTIVYLMVFLPFSSLVYLMELSVLNTGNRVLHGEDVQAKDRAKLHNRELVDINEKLVYFYSPEIFDIAKQGIGVTPSRVVIYNDISKMEQSIDYQSIDYVEILLPESAFEVSQIIFGTNEGEYKASLSGNIEMDIQLANYIESKIKGNSDT